jgi:hypothetical protein
MRNINLFILKWKEGKGASCQRDREIVCARGREWLKNGVGVYRKTAVGRRINYSGISENSSVGDLHFHE